MRKFVSFLLLALVATSAFAAPTQDLPEPESLALFGIGALAFLASRRTKK
jgi:hypothetical protein